MPSAPLNRQRQGSKYPAPPPRSAGMAARSASGRSAPRSGATAQDPDGCRGEARGEWMFLLPINFFGVDANVGEGSSKKVGAARLKAAIQFRVLMDERGRRMRRAEFGRCTQRTSQSWRQTQKRHAPQPVVSAAACPGMQSNQACTAASHAHPPPPESGAAAAASCGRTAQSR